MKKVRVYDNANLKRDHILVSAPDTGLIPEAVAPEKTTRGKTLTAYEEAYKRYHSYILAHGKRFTPERVFVLKQLYAQKNPIDIKTLHELVCKEEGQVSLSTIYNSLSMLIDARLVRRLDLVNGAMAFFEKTLGVEPHGYAICQSCGKVKTLQISKFLPLIDEQMPKGFLTTDLNLQVNGLCKKCQTAAKKQADIDRKAAIKQRKATVKAAVLARQKNKKKKK